MTDKQLKDQLGRIEVIILCFTVAFMGMFGAAVVLLLDIVVAISQNPSNIEAAFWMGAVGFISALTAIFYLIIDSLVDWYRSRNAGTSEVAT
jgi:membrane protein YdbS with pleckstrin-like domain